MVTSDVLRVTLPAFSPTRPPIDWVRLPPDRLERLTEARSMVPLARFFPTRPPIVWARPVLLLRRTPVAVTLEMVPEFCPTSPPSAAAPALADVALTDNVARPRLLMLPD